MRKIWFVLIAICLMGCSKDESDVGGNNNGRLAIETVRFELLPTGGVRLTGRLSNLNKQVNYGFVISSNQDPIYEASEIRVQESGESNGDFSMDITSGLVEDLRYYFKAFIFTGSEFLYGQEKTFESNGSSAPFISEVIPNRAHILDTISLKGTSFSEDVVVLFNQEASTILSKSDSLITCIVPSTFDIGEQLETLKLINVSGGESEYEDFALHTPVIDSITPRKAYETDTLIFHGKHFDFEKSRNMLTMDIDGQNVVLPILESSRTHIKVENTRGFVDLYPKFGLISQLQNIRSEDQLEVLLPEITEAPECVNTREDFTIYGTNFPRRTSTQNRVNIGEAEFRVKYTYRDSLIVEGGSGNVDDFMLNNVVFNYLGENIVFEKEICVADAWLHVGYHNPAYVHQYQGNIYGLVDINNQYTIGRFNPKSNDFSSVNGTSIPFEVRQGILKTFHQGKLYSYSANPNNDQNTFLSYDLLTDQVVLLSPFPGEVRENGLIATVGDDIYMGLGATVFNEPHQDIWKYSIIDDSWEKVIDFTEVTSGDNSRQNPLTFVYGNTIYFGIGQRTGYHDDFWAFDTTAKTISPQSPFPNSISGIQKATVLGQKAYFEDYYLYEYDIPSNTWRIYSDAIRPNFTYGGISQSIFNLDGKIYRTINSSAPYYNILYILNPNVIEP